MDQDKVLKSVATQSAYAGMGALAGAVSKHALTPKSCHPVPVAAQITSAMGAAASNGAGVSGAMAAGGAVVLAKAAAVTAAATAAAPFVLGAAAIGGAIWGLSKLFESSDS